MNRSGGWVWSFAAIMLFMAAGDGRKGLRAHAAQAGAGEIAEKRIAYMRAIADDMRAVADMLFGVARFDGAQVARLMGHVRSRTGAAMLKQFPKNSTAPNSRAKSLIWKADGTLDAAFIKHAEALETLAARLQDHARAEAKAGTVARVQEIVAQSAYLNIDRKLLAEARTAMKPLRETFTAMASHCKGCHESFREKKEENAQDP